MREILQQSAEILNLMFNKTILLFSTIVGMILTAIGYPKQILFFIFTLVIIDLITKQYSLTVANYNKFSFSIYIRAWKERYLTSRALKNGIGIKCLLYLPVLYIAHQATIIPELLLGNVISHVMYTVLMLVETTSILENFIDAGHTDLLPLLKYVKKKEQQIIDEE